MADCVKIEAKKSKVCAGSLDREILICSRAIQPPALDGVDFSEDFTTSSMAFAMVDTPNGVTIFDQSNIERVVTHDFHIRFIAGLTAESWIKFNGDLYDILQVTNLEERSLFMKLRCNKRGDQTVPTNYA